MSDLPAQHEAMEGVQDIELDDDALPVAEAVSEAIDHSIAQDAEVGMFKPSRSVRFFAFAFGIIPVVLLTITTQLKPDQSGLGTHHQLGLPPCTSRVMFGVRCPGCGMTTSWSHFVRGHWISSVRSNSGGFLLALLCFPFAFLCWKSFVSGRPPTWEVQNRMGKVVLAIGLVTLVDWTLRLYREWSG